MATNTTYLEVLKAQTDSVKAEYRIVLGSDSISKNTKHTKSYNLRREIKRLEVITGLVAITTKESLDALMKKDKNFATSFLSIINPEDGGSRIVVKKGDTLLGIIQANPEAKDVVNRAMNYAKKNGLKLGSDGNTFVQG
jgi:hypothetical protein